MRHRLFWILLMGLGVALILLVARHDAGTIGGLDNRDFALLTVKIAILVAAGGLVLALFRDRFAQALIAMFTWIFITLVLAVGYTYRMELSDTADRVLADLIPGRPVVHGQSVEITRGDAGDFHVATQINGATISMTLDTGASTVVLTQDAAKAAGLPIEVLTYTVGVDTANGHTRAAPVTLDRLAIGGIVERSVSALVAQPGQLKTSLLGLSFLNRLESWEVRGDKLLMHGYP